MPKADPLEGSGLLLTGQVTARRRRKFDKKGGQGHRYNIELSFLTSDGVVKCERWADIPMPSDTPETGSVVKMPVIMQHYSSGTRSGTRLIWGGLQDSESF